MSTILIGIVVTGQLNWAVFERRSLKAFTQGSLRWMFSRAKMAWPLLLQSSIRTLLSHYDITSGTPDPKLKAWHKEHKRLKGDGIHFSQRPVRPNSNPDYPTKQALAVAMVDEFTRWFPDFIVKSVLADALYGTREFMDKASAATGGAQVVSQLRSNQLVFSRDKKFPSPTIFLDNLALRRHCP